MNVNVMSILMILEANFELRTKSSDTVELENKRATTQTKYKCNLFVVITLLLF